MARLKALRPRLTSSASRLKVAVKVVEPFYQSKGWKTLVARRKLDRDYFAAKWRAKGDGSDRVILDHIHERKDGGDDLDPANTQWLTMREHNSKTAKAKAERATGRR